MAFMHYAQTHVPSSLHVPLVCWSKVTSSSVKPPVATHTRIMCLPACRRVWLLGGNGSGSSSTQRNAASIVRMTIQVGGYLGARTYWWGRDWGALVQDTRMRDMCTVHTARLTIHELAVGTITDSLTGCLVPLTETRHRHSGSTSHRERRRSGERSCFPSAVEHDR